MLADVICSGMGLKVLAVFEFEKFNFCCQFLGVNFFFFRK